MQKRKHLIWQLPFLTLLIVGTILIIAQQQNQPYRKIQGKVFGTFYHITYQSGDDLQKEIDAALQAVDNSLSPFNPHSLITKVNENQPAKADKQFADVFKIAQEVARETGGAFDITVAPLVNLWGFGFKSGTTPDSHTIDSLLRYVGYEKVKLLSDGRVEKSHPNVMLDCSAVAKGYGSDAVAAVLSRHGVVNYMVEIGGEIVARGVSEKRVPWRIGVSRPTDDPLQTSTEYETVLNVTDKSMATSGNYRNFYYKDGKKYAHTIDPKSGRPVQHSLLSATVLADDCATADAYATAFMVLGMEKAREVVARHPELMVYFIYSADDGSFSTWFSPTLKDKIVDAR